MEQSPTPLVSFLTFMTVLTTMALAYMLPTIIAKLRKHPDDLTIFLTNAFFGWTVIGWLWTLVWSVLPVRRPDPDEPDLIVRVVVTVEEAWPVREN